MEKERNSYADIIFYRQEYEGEFQGTDRALWRILEQASHQIDGLTFNRIVGRFDKLTEHQKYVVKRACCFQADFLDEFGPEGGDMVTGYAVGDVRVDLGGSGEGKAHTEDFSAMGYRLLEQSGLMARGV